MALALAQKEGVDATLALPQKEGSCTRLRGDVALEEAWADAAPPGANAVLAWKAWSCTRRQGDMALEEACADAAPTLTCCLISAIRLMVWIAQ